jgi:hypothetical protein
MHLSLTTKISDRSVRDRPELFHRKKNSRCFSSQLLICLISIISTNHHRNRIPIITQRTFCETSNVTIYLFCKFGAIMSTYGLIPKRSGSWIEKATTKTRFSFSSGTGET